MIPAHNICIHVWKPLIVAGTSYVPRGSLITDSLIERIGPGDYSHTTQADGWWWSASLRLSGSISYIDWWTLNGLGLHIETYSPDRTLIFAGFVNSLDASGGTFSGRQGALLDIGNRIEVQYSPILDATLAQPLVGPQRVTTIAEDTDSQDRYGIFDQTVSGGELLDDGVTDHATQYRDLYLYENTWPQHSEQFSLEGSAPASITLEILGYGHMFDAINYSDLNTNTVTITTKLGYVLAADPNGLFNTSTSYIATNAVLAPRYDDKGRSGLTVIENLIKLGDVSSNRYLWGVKADQTLHYWQAPTDPYYEHRIRDRVPRVLRYGTSQEIYPWDIEPGRIVFLSDYLLGQSIPSDRRRDPRSVFIEQVQYTYPWDVSISGAQQFKLPQFLANVRG